MIFETIAFSKGAKEGSKAADSDIGAPVSPAWQLRPKRKRQAPVRYHG